MSDEDSRLIRQAYAAALQRDPEEREDYLNQRWAGRPDIRSRVMALLETHLQDFGEAPPARSSDAGPHTDSAETVAFGLEGRRIGSYVIRRELGRGGMGVVYLADDTRLSRAVAIKALSPGLAQAPGLRERLRNEARLAAGLSHPGIATVYALEEIDGELYLVCEYVPGAALRVLVREGALPSQEVVDIGLQLARALVEAHTKGIVHRDIKPENVIKTPSGVVKILDFGLARADGSGHPKLTQTGVVLGTPAYLAPEQALGRPTDFRTDIFAFGLLLYELASGTNPFVATTITATIGHIVDDEAPPLSTLHPGSPPELDRILQRCLRKDPRQRYGSTHEIIVELERLRDDLATHPPTAAPAVTPSPSRSKPLEWLVAHQVFVSAIYVLMLYPSWHVRAWLVQPWSLLFLMSVLAAVAAGTSLRLHLWFTATAFPRQFAEQQAWTWRWTRLCDVTFAVALTAAAAAFGNGHPEFAMLFVGVAVATLVASFVIEPATARAALR